MKFYDQILSGLRSFFSLAEATESELHQALADAGTIDGIKEKAKEDAKAEFQAMVDDLSAKVSANTEAVDGLKAEVESLKADLKTAQDALAAKETELEASNTKVKELSTELASLKVENASVKTSEKADDGLKTETPKQQGTSHKVVSNADFLAMFN